MLAYRILLNFYLYGFIGWCVEVAYATLKERQFINRGFLNGPICPIYGVGVTVVIHTMEPYAANLGVLYVLAAALVTVLELVTGFVLEKLFHQRWWDYTKRPFNIGGYVCLPFSMMWGVACVFIVRGFHPLVMRGVRHLSLWFGVTFLVMGSVILAIDLCVTVSHILKMNRKLERMEEIAQELHRISDQMGEKIFENVMEGMERGEEFRQNVKEGMEKGEEFYQSMKESVENSAKRSEELYRNVKESFELSKRSMATMPERERLEARFREMKEKYQELMQTSTKGTQRILRAFPNIRSNQHREIFRQWKETLKERREQR